MNDIVSILPEIAVCTGGFFMLLLQAFAGQKAEKLYVPFSCLILFITTGLLFVSPADSRLYFSDQWITDAPSRYFKLVFLTGSLLAVLVSSRYTKENSMKYGEYFALILFATGGMMGMAGGVDFIILFLSLELLSLSIYALTGARRGDAKSGEAAFKYFILGAFATAVLLFGIALLYGATGTANITKMAFIFSAGIPAKGMAATGVIFVLIGFAFKTAFVPFHMWTPDVYEGAPAPVTAFMAAGVKAASFAAFIRVFIFSWTSSSEIWTTIIWIMAVLTMVIANAAALVQNSVKRMLAYSSIVHAGYLLVGFLSMDRQGTGVMAFYLLAYTLMNGGAFAFLILLSGKGEKNMSFDDYRGLAYRRPVPALMMTLFLVSLAGIPPTAGFTAKFFLFTMAVQKGWTGLAIIAVINSVVSVYYYLRLTIQMYMREDISSEMAGISFPFYENAALYAAAAGTILLGLIPGLFLI